MTTKKEIEDAIKKSMKSKDIMDDDIDKAKLMEDDDLKVKDVFGKGDIKNALGIDEDDMWEGKPVDSKDAFNQLDAMEDVSQDIEEEASQEEMSENEANEDNEDNEEDDEVNEEANDDEEEDEADKLIKQTMRIKPVQQHKSEVSKDDVMNQIKLYDTSLDIRMKYQLILKVINTLPLSGDLETLKTNNPMLKNQLDILTSSLQELSNEMNRFVKVTDKVTKEGSDNKEKNKEMLQILEKWHAKTSMMNISKFSSKQNGISQQVNAVMKDKERLYRRCRQLRETKIYLNEDLTTSNEIYDDGDFYQQMIKDAVDYGIVGKNNSNIQINNKKKNKKVKQRVQTNLVYPKLENFMTPVEYRSDLNEGRSVLIKNLFK